MRNLAAVGMFVGRSLIVACQGSEGGIEHQEEVGKCLDRNCKNEWGRN